jgi:uncharacterized protein (TIGR03435 family)
MTSGTRTLLTTILAISGAYAQEAPKQFDVASIKPTAQTGPGGMINFQPGGRFVTTSMPLRMLMTIAYDVRMFQISGGPNWTESDRWDIRAKADNAPDRIPIEQLRPMLRQLLEDRFQLKIHRESKEMPVYALMVAKGGSKLAPYDPNTTMPGFPPGPGVGVGGPPPPGAAAAPPRPAGPMMRMGRGEMVGKKVPMTMMAQSLSNELNRTIVDKTELTGDYDFTLHWTPDAGGPPPNLPPGVELPAIDPNGPTLFTALQEQLGLRLESQKGPVETIVIDHVEKPTEN